MVTDQFGFEFAPTDKLLRELWTPDDIYINSDQSIVQAFAEDRRVERKRFEIGQKDFAAYLSMWGNTQPSGGVIFIGVDNEGKIRGCLHGTTDRLNQFETARKLCPDAPYEIKRVPVVDVNGRQNFVLAVRVAYNQNKLVETVDGSAFIREGDEKRLLSEGEKREIRLNKGELTAEAERVNLKYPDDFDSRLLSGFRDSYLSKRNLPQRFSTEDVLQLCKLGQKSPHGFTPNLAGALIFAKDSRVIVPGAFIRVFRYEGPEEGLGQKMNAVADQLFDGPLPDQLASAEKYIESQIRNFTRLGKDGRFITRPEYPKDVWLEAVVNAVVHRSYNLKNMASIYVSDLAIFAFEAPVYR